MKRYTDIIRYEYYELESMINVHKPDFEFSDLNYGEGYPNDSYQFVDIDVVGMTQEKYLNIIGINPTEHFKPTLYDYIHAFVYDGTIPKCQGVLISICW